MVKESSLIWCTSSEVNVENISAHHWRWLSHPGSLTARFQSAFGSSMSFQLLGAYWSTVYREEALLLRLESCEQQWVREIQWSYQGRCWVVARVIIPRETDSALISELMDLGQVSIGTRLFSSSDVVQGQIELAKLTIAHPYYRLAEPRLQGDRVPVWARRRTFSHAGTTLLVVELFLPSFFQHNLGCEHDV